VSNELPPMAAELFNCPGCGEELCIADHPAHSYEDGRKLGPLYLTRDGRKHLWPLFSGDAGAFEQRCPGCNAILPMPPREKAAEQLELI
jgi:hypothetical protein